MSKHLKSLIEFQLQSGGKNTKLVSRTWYVKAADISPQSISAALLFNLDKNLDKKKYILYKPAKIYNAGGDLSGTWFVHFSFRNSTDEKFKRQKITGDINRIEDVETRTQAAKILQRLINEALADGWNPTGQQTETVIYTYNVVTAITDQLTAKKKVLSKTTAVSYDSRVNMFIEWLKAEHLDNLDIKDFQPVHAERYNNALLDKGNNHKTINGTNETLRGLFTKMVKLKIIADNPYNAIDRLKVTESNWFAPLTDDEITTIAAHLRKVKPELFVFFCFIYYSYMRPISIVQLTADNFDFKERIIYLEGKQHKNRKSSIKQMLQPLYDVLVEYQYDRLQPGTFFFSTGLRPGKNVISPKRASNFWNEFVITGLGINKKLYAGKHTGGSNYLTDNTNTVDLNWLQKQMGHSSLQETETYIKKRTAAKLDESKASIRKI